MGELKGELAERYSRLVGQRKRLEGSAQEQDGTSTTFSSSENAGVPSNQTRVVGSGHSYQTVSNSQPQVKRESNEKPLPRRRSHNKAFMEVRAARYQRKMAQDQKEKEATIESVSNENEQGSDVCQNTGDSDAVVRERSTDTRRIVNATAHRTRPVQLVVKSDGGSSDADSKSFHRTSATKESSMTMADEETEDAKSEDSFPPLDWHKIEQEAKGKDSYSHPSIDGSGMLQEPLDFKPDGMSEYVPPLTKESPVSPSKKETMDGEGKLIAILEEQAESAFENGSAHAVEQNCESGMKYHREDLQNATKFEARLSVSKLHGVAPEPIIVPRTASEESNARRARAYHRPHTGEKVVVAEDDRPNSNVKEKTCSDGKDDLSNSPSLRREDEKEDVSHASEKRKKRKGRTKSKRKSRKPTQSQKTGKDSDPLGRAVSLAFDKFAGYSGLQEDLQSVAASDAPDENTYDEDYSSDESESVMGDLHDVLLTTFGCSVPQTSKLHLNDDDTLDTDCGSKVSGKKFIRHTRSGSHASDSLYSEPSGIIRYASSYDKTEVTNEDEGAADMTEPKNQAPKSTEVAQDKGKGYMAQEQEQAPQFKVPKGFDGSPPILSTSVINDGEDLPSKAASSVYSGHTGKYMDFVEKDHRAVNLLEEADSFFFGDDPGGELLKTANENVDKFVASIQDFIGSNFENESKRKRIGASVVPKPGIEKPVELVLGSEGVQRSPDVLQNRNNSLAAPFDEARETEAVVQQSAQLRKGEEMFALPPISSPQSGVNDEASVDTLEELKMQLAAEAWTAESVSHLEEQVEEEKKEEEILEVNKEVTTETPIAELSEDFVVQMQERTLGDEQEPTIYLVDGTESAGEFATESTLIATESPTCEIGEGEEVELEEMFAAHPRRDRTLEGSQENIKPDSAQQAIEGPLTDESLSPTSKDLHDLSPDVSAVISGEVALSLNSALPQENIEQELVHSTANADTNRSIEPAQLDSYSFKERAGEEIVRIDAPVEKIEDSDFAVADDTVLNTPNEAPKETITLSFAPEPEDAMPVLSREAQNIISIAAASNKKVEQVSKQTETKQLVSLKKALSSNLVESEKRKKKKLGVITGLLRPFKKNKNVRPNKKSASTSMKAVCVASQSASIVHGRAKVDVSGSPQRSIASRDVNELMDSYVSEKFDAGTDAFDSIMSQHAVTNDWDQIDAKPPSRTSGQRGESSQQVSLLAKNDSDIVASLTAPIPLVLECSQKRKNGSSLPDAALNVTAGHCYKQNKNDTSDPNAAHKFHSQQSPPEGHESSPLPPPSGPHFEAFVDDANGGIIVSDNLSSAESESRDNSQAWKEPDFKSSKTDKCEQFSSVYCLDLSNESSQPVGMQPPSTGNYIQHTSEKWEAVLDSFNEGIDIREASYDASLFSEFTHVSVDRESVLNASVGLGDKPALPIESPQKVSDFPIERIQSQASF